MAKLTRWALACAAACLAFCGVAAGAATKLYIVRFHDTATADAPAEVQAVFKELYARHENGQHKDWHAVPEAEFERIFSGAAVRMSESAADWLRSHPSVADIEEDQEFHIIEPIHSLPKPVDMLQLQKTSKRDLGSVNPAVSQRRALQTTSIRSQSGEAIERFGLWSLDRIDQANAPPYSSSYSYGTDGDGVDVYVVDSGVLQTHIDFDGRALAGFDGINDGLAQASDCNGHGTHVAGTVGGTISGVAKNATLIAVRVFGCTGGGSTAVILNALEWVSRTAAQRATTLGRRAVVNMSLGGGRSTTFDAATNKLVREGIVVVVAAGNENQDAANASPAAAELAIAVGATDIQDVKATFSNFGPTVDIQAPGVDIFSAWHTSDTAAQTIDGTSMASPAVAGMAARYLQQRPAATPQEVREALLCSAQRNTLTQIPADGTPNVMLFSTPLGLAVPNADGSCGSPPTESPSDPVPTPAPPVGCPSDCSGRGTCRSDGTCACNCGWLGADCRIQVPISEGVGLTGAIRGRTSDPDSSAVFGQESPERFVALTVPAGVTQLTVGTCDPSTNYDTLIWLLSSCPSQDLTNSDVVGVNDDGPVVSCQAPTAPLPPYTVANFPPPSQLVVNNPTPGRYYVLIEGYQAFAGDYVLSWEMAAPPGTVVPSASPTPGAVASATPITKPTSGLSDENDDGFNVGQPAAAAAAAASVAGVLSALAMVGCCILDLEGYW